jgi:hypothetical protein
MLTTFCLTLLSSNTLANVYICTNDNCTIWRDINPTQYDAQATDGTETTIRQALSESSDDSIKNGYKNASDTNLYLKNVLWHLGGQGAFADIQHVTAYVYKSTDLNYRIKSCHIFSSKTPTGTYHTTCEVRK